MEFEVPKSHILRPTLYADMVQRVLQWERQTNALVEKDKDPWQRNVVIIIVQYIFLFKKGGEEKMKTRKDKRMVKLYFILFFQNFLIWAYIFLNQHIHFLVHGHSAWSTFGLHLVRGPKTL